MVTTHCVTGAYGYSGKYIANRLLTLGQKVFTLTNSADRPNPFGESVKAFPFHFDQPDLLTESLRGVDVLYNTYWVRFGHDDFSHTKAVANTKTLFQAAKDAGVRRVVHVSITNPDINSDLPYFRGKAELEQTLIDSGLSYAILRPTVLFGLDDILVNNIAWAVRHLPVFGMFGDGEYKIQPIYVDDLAELAVEQGMGSENVIIDAIGPETFTYRELVNAVSGAIGKRVAVMPMPPGLALVACNVFSKMVKDVIVTKEEVEGLTRGLLVTPSSAAGKTALTEWMRENGYVLGTQYHSELARRRRRNESYDML